MTSKINRQDNGNIELTFSIVWADIAAASEKVIDKAVEDTEIKGFRKGKAPRKLVEEQLDQSKVLSQAITDLLPKAYTAAVNEHQLKPVLYPKVQVQKGKTGEDWEFLALTCEAPEVELPDLAKTIGHLESKLETRMEALRNKAKTKFSDLIVEEEANHRLSHLAENLSSLGVTVEKYLESKKMTLDDLKARTSQESRHDLGVEFILQKIQADNKLTDRKATLDFITNLV